MQGNAIDLARWWVERLWRAQPGPIPEHGRVVLNDVGVDAATFQCRTSSSYRWVPRLLTTRGGSSGARNDGFSRRTRCAVAWRTDRPYRSDILRVRLVWALRFLAARFS